MLVANRARQQVRESDSTLSTAADLLSDFTHTWSRPSFSHPTASFLGGWLHGTLVLAGYPSFHTEQPLQQNLGF